MPIQMHHERDNVYRLEIRGTLGKTEFDDCAGQLAAELERLGAIRLLCVLQEFRGWDARGNWGDMRFFATHGGSIERIAIVGPPKWRDEALIFAGADLRRAPVEFFPTGMLGEARTWVAA
jgi:hypothetical protein